MANPEHVAKLKEGVEAWNQWREDYPDAKIDLDGANLCRAYLRKANLSRADLRKSDLSESDLREANLGKAKLGEANLFLADLSEANLRYANLYRAILVKTHLYRADLSEAYLGTAELRMTDLVGADLVRAKIIHANLTEVVLRDANLRHADLSKSDLSGADLREADLRGANLNGAILVQTNLEQANLTGCNVYGISVWDARLDGAIQSNLVITQADESAIQVDNLEVAQFIYLLLNNERIRNVIDTITSKVVLILGRFTPERKAVLDAIRDELRKREYLPILFDFQKPDSKDLTGTISTLANMARFVIADLTEPSSVPHELATIAPGTVVPIQTILLAGQREYAMFPDLRRRYSWVLEPYQYQSERTLLADLTERVIVPAEAKVIELKRK
jgi:uncharacterized protein YjbI with pentapeptide repeats